MHTKGEWKLSDEGPWVYIGDEGTERQDIATIWSCDNNDASSDIPAKEAKANAKLIAASPDMYDALKEAYELLKIFHGNSGPEMKRIKAAIAKATGE